MKGRLIWSIFLALVAVFLVVAIGIFIHIGIPRNLLVLVKVLFYIIPWALLLLLGVALIVLTVRGKIRGMLRTFLLLTGASAIVMIISIVSHNLMDMWFGIEDSASLITSFFVCPIAFLVGGVGSVFLGFKESPSRAR